MESTGWAAVLMGTLAVLLAAAFVLLWIRDKGRADEESGDPERAHTGDHLGPDAREGAADVLPPETRERRH
jgi:hypothetical protein